MISTIAKDSSFPTFVAGDLNSTPPRFPEHSTDGKGRNAISVFDKSRVLRRHPSLPPTDESQFTFHSVGPACVIDWVLVPEDWELLQYEVVSSQLSDHRPVFADVTFNPAPRSNNN
jgi:endonuclease/exonuclease/phosphatase family metal-dependent hydrolase